MIGPSKDSKGGIASVINLYRKDGLHDRWPLFYCSTFQTGSKSTKYKVAISGLFKFFNMTARKRILAVHSHTSSHNSFWRKSIFFAFAYIWRVPWILHLHGSQFRIFWDNECSRVKKRWITFVFQNSICVITLSSKWRSWVVNTFNPPKTVILPNPTKIYNIADRIGNSKNILFLGHLCQRKGVYELFEAISELIRTDPKVRLWCCGEGDISVLNRTVLRLGIKQNVQFKGWVTGDTKKHLIERSTIFALPSRNEGVPLSMLEAMSAGLPVVVSAVGGIPDVVTDGVEGFLIDPTDVRMLTDRLRQLVQDDNLCRRMGRAGRCKVAKDHSLQVVMQRLEEIYTDLGIPPKSR